MLDCPVDTHYEWSCDQSVEYYRGEVAALFQAELSRGHHPDHIVIIPNGELSTLAKTISVANSILVDDLQYPATYIIGKFNRTFEVIPRGSSGGDKSECNLCEKLAMVDYALFERGGTLQANQKVSPRKLDKRLVTHLKMNTAVPIEQAQSFTPFVRKITCVREALAALVERVKGEDRSIFHELCRAVKFLLVNVVPPEYETKVDHCAFCTEAVVENQLIYSGEKCHVLYNYLPWSANHFMVVTKEHKQHWQMLTKEEKQEVLRIGEAIGKAIRARYPGTEVQYVIQNGIAAGQTQPHMHMHVLSVPPIKEYYVQLIEEVLSRKKMLTPEQISEKRNEFESIIHSFLE